MERERLSVLCMRHAVGSHLWGNPQAAYPLLTRISRTSHCWESPREQFLGSVPGLHLPLQDVPSIGVLPGDSSQLLHGLSAPA